MYRLALRLAEPLLSTMQMNLLKFALSLRYYSPAIAMYAQVGLAKLLYVYVLIVRSVQNVGHTKVYYRDIGKIMF